MKRGTFVYYYNKYGDTIPAQVIKTSIGKKAGQRIKIHDPHTHRLIWVSASKVELQSDKP